MKVARLPSMPLVRSWRGMRSERVLVIDDERRMVRKTPLLVNGAALGRCREIGRGDLVVDTPSHVLRPSLPAIGPPGVLIGAAIEAPESIHPTELVEDARQPLAFLGQEAGVLAVAAPVLQVDFLMRDVPVAAEHDVPAFGAKL